MGLIRAPQGVGLGAHTAVTCAQPLGGGAQASCILHALTALEDTGSCSYSINNGLVFPSVQILGTENFSLCVHCISQLLPRKRSWPCSGGSLALQADENWIGIYLSSHAWFPPAETLRKWLSITLDTFKRCDQR